MKRNRVHGFVKFGLQEHLEKLLTNGEVYFQKVSAFKKSVEPERGDEYETVSHIVRGGMTFITFNHPTVGAGKINLNPNDPNIFCEFDESPLLCCSLYAISNRLFDNNNKHQINEKMLKLGDTAVMIMDSNRFLKSIITELEKLNLNFSWNIINYVDISENGEYNLSYFDKSMSYSHQEEYRILVECDKPELKLILGHSKSMHR